MGYSVISKVQNTYPSIQENADGLTFVQKVAEFYELIESVNNSKAGLLFMQSVAFGLCVEWSVLVEYIYCLVKAKKPSLYNDYVATLDYQYVCQNIGGVFGKLLDAKADSVFANKYLFDAVVANTGADSEEWLQSFILEKYGWHNVMRDIAIMYDAYLGEQAQIAEKQDRDYIQRTIVSINKSAKEKKGLVISVAIADALTEDEYSTLYNWISEDKKIAKKLHLKAVEGKVYSDKEEVKVVVSIEKAEEPLEDAPIAEAVEEEVKEVVSVEKAEEPLEDAPIAETVEDVEDKVEETKEVPTPTVAVTTKKVITKEDVKVEYPDAVIATDENGNIQHFNSPKEASETLGIKLKYIHKRLNGDGKSTGKGKSGKHYTFKYVTPHIKKGMVLQIDPKTNEVVASFKRVTDAEREYGFKPTKLNGVLKTVNKLCDGYMWMYESEFKEKFPSMEYGKVA